LEKIYARGLENGVRCTLIDAARLAELEPHAAGVAAIHVPDAGIVDFPGVAEALARKVVAAGGEIRTGAAVTGIEQRVDGLVIQTNGEEVECGYAVTCAGLQSDRVARLSGAFPDAKIVPFRGEYYELSEDARSLCRNLIYPV